MVLVAFVLPAEYGIDPLGTGHLLGLDALHDPTAEAPQQVNTTSRALYLYNVTFPSVSRLAHESTGASQAGEEERVDIDVYGANLVLLTAEFTWMDEGIAGQPSQPDLFEAQWTDPSGRAWPANQARNDASGNGALQTVAFIDAPPEPAKVEAADEQGALAAMKLSYPPSARGTGRWSLAIRLLEAPGVGGALPDGGNPWSLKVFARSYEPALGSATSTHRVEDTFDLAVGPRRSLEFKLRMEEGRPLSYEWDAGTPVSYDFHGDRAETTGEYQSHEQGEAATKKGDFMAPFSGRHGWYFRNDGADPVTVRLHLRGEYRIVGIVA